MFLFQNELVTKPDSTNDNAATSLQATIEQDNSKVIDWPLFPNKNSMEQRTNTSSCETGSIKTEETEPSKQIDESNVDFTQNRELWQRRANLESTPASPLLKTHRFSEPYIQRQNHTPDLVMDLPVVGNSSPKELAKSMSVLSSTYSDSSPEDDASPTKLVENKTGADSPDMQTAAETFAKQNQCTLKKNKKIQMENTEYVTITSPMLDRKYATLGSNTSTTTTFKPQPKTKPMVLKKPVFSVPLRSVSIEMMCKDPPDLPT